MKPKSHHPKRLGIPRDVPPELRKALALELEKLGTTYPEFILGLDPPPTPEIVLELAHGWNNLTPEQKAAWEAYAAQENDRRSLRDCAN